VSERLSVRTVQPSGSVTSSAGSAEIIGSTAITRPSVSGVRERGS